MALLGLITACGEGEPKEWPKYDKATFEARERALRDRNPAQFEIWKTVYHSCKDFGQYQDMLMKQPVRDCEDPASSAYDEYRTPKRGFDFKF